MATKEFSTNLQHQTGHVTVSDGLRLFQQSWLPPEPSKAAIVLVHGVGEHSSRYHHVADVLVQNNYAVHSFDLRGHGQSPGERFYVDNFDAYVNDLHDFLQQIAATHAGQPIFLLGHSMGGAIVTLYAIQHQPAVAGIVLSAAALKIGDDIPKLLIALSAVIGRLLPKLPTVKLDTKLLSRDAEVVRKYETDPLVNHAGTRARLGAEIIRTTKRIQAEMERFALPVLIMHGTDDAIVDPEGSRQLFERAGTSDKSLKLYEGFYHEIMNEPEKERVFSDIMDWLNRHI